MIAQPIKAKSELLADLFRQPASFVQIGPAFPLFLWLIFNNGVFVGTYDQLGKLAGCTSRTARNWAEHLEKQGVVTKEKKGRQAEVKLTTQFLTIATAYDRLSAETENRDPRLEDPEIQAFLRVFEQAKQKKDFLKYERVVSWN